MLGMAAGDGVRRACPALSAAVHTFLLIWFTTGSGAGFRLAREANTVRGFIARVIGCTALGPVAFLFTPKRD